jgi:uncharacterized cysteine cluster protein YcgN (CxxCxxCC family)
VTTPFWKTTKLEAMSDAQWESLCDGCALCCLHKLEDEDTGRVHLTVIACKLLDIEACRCTDYAERSRRVPECVTLRPDNVKTLALPDTCAYVCVAEGRDLPDFHPLVTGDAGSTTRTKNSVAGFAISELDVDLEDAEDYLLDPVFDDEP